MKIALVTETFAPDINGVAMTLERLTISLVAKGHAVSVVRTQSSHPAGTILHDDAIRNVPQTSVRGFALPGYTAVKIGMPSFFKLVGVWRKSRPDLVHVATEGPLGLSALFAAKRLGIPVISTFHTNFHQYTRHYKVGWLEPMALAYLRWFHNQTLRSLVPDPTLAAELTSRGFAHMQTWTRGVDSTLFDPARRSETLRQSWGARPETPVVLHVSRMAAEKNLDLLAEGFHRIHKAVPTARFVLVGDGPETERFRKKFPDAIFTHDLRGEALAEHYASADVFLFASETETFGNVVTEAMGSGLAVLAYDYAAPGQYIDHGLNGWKVPFSDSAAWLDAAVKLVQSPDLWPGLRENARKTILTIPWQRLVGEYEAHCAQVTGSGEPGPRDGKSLALHS